MQTHKFTMPGQWWLRPLMATLAAAAGAGAWADEPTPWYLGVNQSLNYDSNVFRTPIADRDVYSKTSLLGGFDQPVGRQRFYAAANVGYNKYRNATSLDNTSYGVNTGWDWATIEKLSGSLTANANQSLASADNNALLPLSTRNVINTDQFGANARWGGDGLLALDGSYAHSRLRYSAPEYLTSKSSSDTGSIGGSYRLGPDIRVGTAYRVTRTVSPFAVPLVANPTGPADYASNTENGRNIDLTANWATTAQTGVNARLSWTRQTNTDLGERNFSGLTGSLTASYAPTAKLSGTFSASRDAGANASFFNYTGAPPANGSTQGTTVRGLSENSQTTDAFSLGLLYAATAKVSLNANLQYSHAKLLDTVAAGGTTSTSERSDNTHGASLGATYAVARGWQLGCNVGFLSRRVSGATGYSYRADTASCSAQFMLR